MHKLLNKIQRVGLAGIILCVLVGQHDETFMVIYSSKGAKIKRGLVAGVELG